MVVIAALWCRVPSCQRSWECPPNADRKPWNDLQLGALPHPAPPSISRHYKRHLVPVSPSLHRKNKLCTRLHPRPSPCLAVRHLTEMQDRCGLTPVDTLGAGPRSHPFHTGRQRMQGSTFTRDSATSRMLFHRCPVTRPCPNRRPQSQIGPTRHTVIHSASASAPLEDAVQALQRRHLHHAAVGGAAAGRAQAAAHGRQHHLRGDPRVTRHNVNKGGWSRVQELEF